MKKLFINIFVTVSLASFSQNWDWARKPQGSGINSSGNQICADNSGNVYVHGNSDGPIVFGTSTLASGFYVVKYNSSGTVIWATNVAVAANEILADPNGNLFLAGTYTGNLVTATSNYTSQGGNDIFLVKLNNIGIEEWARSYGGSLWDSVNDFIVDKKGNSFLTGLYNGDTLLFGNYTLIDTTATGKFYLARINPQGQTSWVTRGLQASDTLYYWNGRFLGLDKYQNIFAFGYAQCCAPGPGGARYFSAKFDSLGNLVLNRFGIGGYMFSDYSFAMDENCNFYVIGGGGNHPTATLCKYDSLWNFKWWHGLGDPYYCFGLGNVSVDNFGNSYLYGSLTNDQNNSSCLDSLNRFNVFDHVVTPKGSLDLLLAKIDTHGKLNWVKTAGGIGYEWVNDMYVNSIGECYVTGIYNKTFPSTPYGTAWFDNHSLVQDGSYMQCFTAKLGSTTVGLSEFEWQNKSRIHLYPNPSNGVFTLAGGNIKSYRIYNSMGIIIKEDHSDNKEMEIDLQNEPKGFYLIEVDHEFGTTREKIILE